jgi:hypothetical protein
MCGIAGVLDLGGAAVAPVVFARMGRTAMSQLGLQ